MVLHEGSVILGALATNAFNWYLTTCETKFAQGLAWLDATPSFAIFGANATCRNKLLGLGLVLAICLDLNIGLVLGLCIPLELSLARGRLDIGLDIDFSQRLPSANGMIPRPLLEPVHAGH